MKERPLKDVDSAATAQRFRAAVWAVFVCPVFGFVGLIRYGFVGLVVGCLIGFAVVYFGATILADRVGNTGAAMYFGSGSSTPAKREYSLGDALVMQEKYADAVAEFERNAAVYADDPEPRLRLARLYRDRVKQPEQALHWFKQALSLEKIDAGSEAMAARELVELCNKLMQPERAIPALARISERHPSTATGTWARAQLEELKRALRERNG
jgi:tetratricopeptide (TPR) repeat protein